MIKNKILDIKIIFKNIKNKLKIFKILKQIFILQNILKNNCKIWSKFIIKSLLTIKKNVWIFFIKKIILKGWGNGF